MDEHTWTDPLNPKPLGSVSEFKEKEVFHHPKTQIASNYLFKVVTENPRILLQNQARLFIKF